jgi:hypothetical protein
MGVNWPHGQIRVFFHKVIIRHLSPRCQMRYSGSAEAKLGFSRGISGNVSATGVATWPKNRAAALGGKILLHLKPATVGIPGDSAQVGPLQKVTRLITLVRSEVDVLQAGPMPAAECPTKNGGFRCVQGLCRSPQNGAACTDSSELCPDRIRSPIDGMLRHTAEAAAGGFVTSCGYGLPGRVRAFIPVTDDAQATAPYPAVLMKSPPPGHCGGKSIDHRGSS